MAETKRVVAAFLAPNTSSWQGAPVNVTEDGAWWVWYEPEERWVERIPPLGGTVQPEDPESRVMRAEQAYEHKRDPEEVHRRIIERVQPEGEG